MMRMGDGTMRMVRFSSAAEEAAEEKAAAEKRASDEKAAQENAQKSAETTAAAMDMECNYSGLLHALFIKACRD
jgi:membrane protein involved in colicin uptake